MAGHAVARAKCDHSGRVHQEIRADGGWECRAEPIPAIMLAGYENSRTGEPDFRVGIAPFLALRNKSRAGQHPLQSFLELGAFPSAVPCARLHVRQMLWEWGLRGLADSAELLVSELLTNAVQVSVANSQGSSVRLWLLAGATRVLILVWDASELSPAGMNTGEDDENGRGLLLVESISAGWGWYFPDWESGGKVVWALLE